MLCLVAPARFFQHLLVLLGTQGLFDAVKCANLQFGQLAFGFIALFHGDSANRQVGCASAGVGTGMVFTNLLAAEVFTQMGNFQRGIEGVIKVALINRNMTSSRLALYTVCLAEPR